MAKKSNKLLYIFKRVILVYFIIIVALFFLQRSILYYPQPGRNTEYFGADRIELANNGNKLTGWIVNPGRDKAIFYYGGNAECIEYNIIDFKQQFRDYSIYFVNYRGYGGSEGSPNEDDLCADALNVFDKYASKHSEKVLFGRSLGSGVATYVAKQREAQITKMVLVTPYDSIAKVAANIYWMLPIRFLVFDEFDSEANVENITISTLVIQAENDLVIPKENTEGLIKAFTKKPPIVKIICNHGHNNILSKISMDYIIDFLKGSLTE